jgi:hypothetical protein
MQDDVKNLIYIILGLFIVVLVVWIGFVFVSGCGFSLDCEKGAVVPNRTPVPTLIPASMPIVLGGDSAPKVSCQIAAVSLIGEWVSAGYSDSEEFSFTDINGQNCVGNYLEDVQPLFQEGNLWYSGAPACTTCHNSTLSEITAGMDLSTYSGILAGSRRASIESQGNNVLGGGAWESSLLYKQLFIDRAMPQGRPPDVPAEGPIIFAGSVQE